ncbi:MAG: serine/threonine protein kinase [Myxococcaceae bacterium]|nr:serine/threonine protein kinase [Myxococcaceae bacterium]
MLDGKWAIERKLGQGGMGSVYLARDVELDRLVAIKMMTQHLADNQELVTRFEREARMMARLDHPNLIPVYAVGRLRNAPFIVMKYLTGSSLADHLKAHGRLPLAEVLSITRQICDGLQCVHDHGVVHRDIKPANIFLSPEGRVTVLDLGVAHDTKNVMTRSGVIVGTPRYMSPEQILGRRVDRHSDLYALATVVFEMLTGTPVFAGDSDFSVMKAHIDHEPPDVTQIKADLPAGLAPVLKRALAKVPAERFDTSLEFFRALEAGAQTDPAARAELATPPLTGVPVAAPSLAGHELSSVQRRRAWPFVAGAALLALAGVLAVTRPWSATPREPVLPPGSEAPSGGAVLAAAVNPPRDDPERPPEAAKADDQAMPLPTLPEVPAPAAPAPTAATDSATQPSDPVVQGTLPAGEPTGGQVGNPAVTATAEDARARPKKVPPVKRPRAEPTPVEATHGEAQVRLVVKVGGVGSWAYVDVNGVRKGTAPLAVTLEPGTHHFAFRRDGFATVERELTVKPGEDTKLTVELTP